MKNRTRNVLFILGGLIAVNFSFWAIVLATGRSSGLEVSFFDIGQGDAAFIETPSGYQILVDGGPNSFVLEKLRQEMPFWDRTIDLVVLTHPEHDHMAGLISVLESYQVKNVLWTGVVRETSEYQRWQEVLQKEGAHIAIAEAGQEVGLGDNIWLDVLYPYENLRGQVVKNTNDSSVVFKITFNERSFLFTGDISSKVEKQLVERDVDSDIIKIAHHGSKYSTCQEFIGAVTPGIAVISSGRGNSYGHPTPEVLEILDQFDINILRTDVDGDIKIVSDGESLRVER